MSGPPALTRALLYKRAIACLYEWVFSCAAACGHGVTRRVAPRLIYYVGEARQHGSRVPTTTHAQAAPAANTEIQTIIYRYISSNIILLQEPPRLRAYLKPPVFPYQICKQTRSVNVWIVKRHILYMIHEESTTRALRLHKIRR